MQSQARVAPSTLRNSLIVMGGFVLSRVTGVLRDIVVLAQFGTGDALGAYRAAFKLPDLLYLVLIGGALGSTLIPVWIEVQGRDGARRAWRLASAVLGWSLLLLALASLLLAVLAGPLVRLVFSGEDFDPATLQLTVDLTRLFLLSPLLLGLGGLALALLNALDRFTLPALAPSVYNLGILAGALIAPWLPESQQIWALAWGVIGGAALYLLVQIPGLLRAGMRLSLTLGRDLPELGTIARQMAPRVLGQTASHINLVVSAALIAQLPEGADALVGADTAYQLMLLPYGVFALSLSTVAFPTLARLYAARQLDALQANVRMTVATIVTLTLPSAVVLIMLNLPIVRLLFERGAFSTTSTQLTAGPLIGYATVLPAFALSEILIRSFFAMQNTRIPVAVGLLTIALNLALGGVALQLFASALGIALAFSLSNNLEALLLFVLLGRSLPGIWNDRALWRALAAAVLGSGVLLAFLWAVERFSMRFVPALGTTPGAYRFPADFLPLALWLGLVGGLGAVLYLGVSTALGSPVVLALYRRLRLRLGR